MGRFGIPIAPPPVIFLVYSTFLCYCCCPHLSVAQGPIPSRYDGFVYKDGIPAWEDSVIVEAFFDPMCPDTRDSWPPLKQAIDHYTSGVFLIVHPFPLPYHDNSFISCRALHIANKLNASATYSLLELFFKYQEKYYNKQTEKMSRSSVTDHIAKLTLKVIGNWSLSDIRSGFEDSKTDRAARNSYNYGCSRKVIGTPSFFVNGFPLPDSDSVMEYKDWRNIIDSLLYDKKSITVEAVDTAK